MHTFCYCTIDTLGDTEMLNCEGSEREKINSCFDVVKVFIKLTFMHECDPAKWCLILVINMLH